MSTWLQDHIQRNRLLYFLMLYILCISVALAVLSAIAKFYFSYKKEVKKIDEVMLLINESYTKPMSISLWSFDYNQILVQAQGIKNLPNIKKVVVTEQFEGQGKPLVSLGEIMDKAYVKQTFSIDFNSHGVMKHIGTLSVYAGLDQIRNEIKYQIGSGFIILFAEIITLSMCIIFIVKTMIMDHLVKINRFLRDSNTETLSRVLMLDRRPTRKSDILDSIVGFINRIIEQNVSSISRLNTFNQELMENRMLLDRHEKHLKILEQLRNDEAAVWEIIRDNQTVETLARYLISFLCRYFGAGAGLFYQVDEDARIIRAVAGYAVTLNLDQPLEFKIGEGQLGQVVLNNTPCCISPKEVSPLKIQSSLGQAEPDYILMYPFAINERVVCALEMGRFAPFDPDSNVLLDMICEKVASAVETALLKENAIGKRAVFEKNDAQG